jgi:hypothetical protein
MKRLLSAALALSLLSGTAAMADPFGPGPGHHDRFDRDGGGHYRHHGGDGAGTAIAVGFGLLALTAILATSDRDQPRERGYDNPPPPNGRDYGPEYGPNNNQAYDDNPYDGPSNQGQGYDNNRADGPDRQ